MPTYELRCERCHKTFELQDSLAGYIQKKSKGIHCPSCDSIEVQPQLGHVEVKTSKKS